MQKKLALSLHHGNSMLQNRKYDTRENCKYYVIEGSKLKLKSNFWAKI